MVFPLPFLAFAFLGKSAYMQLATKNLGHAGGLLLGSAAACLFVVKANVTSKPSSIQVAPRETTISHCHELHGNRSSRAGTYDSIFLPFAIVAVFRAKKRETQNVIVAQRTRNSDLSKRMRIRTQIEFHSLPRLTIWSKTDPLSTFWDRLRLRT